MNKSFHKFLKINSSRNEFLTHEYKALTSDLTTTQQPNAKPQRDNTSS